MKERKKERKKEERKGISSTLQAVCSRKKPSGTAESLAKKPCALPRSSLEPALASSFLHSNECYFNYSNQIEWN